MIKRERRFLQSDVTIEQGESPKITGYAAVFNKRSHDLGDFVEVIDPHAFDACLSGSPDIKGLINHDDALVLGRTSSGTMKVSVDATGLRYEIDPPATSYANDLLVSMRRKDIDASSFGFYCREDAWTIDRKTGQNVRTILQAEVFDCSVVTNPAYPDASSQVRNLFPDDKGNVPEIITHKIAELRAAKRAEKRGRNILAAVSSAKWAILPEKLETICAFLTGWADGKHASKEEIQAAMMGYEDNGSSFSNESPVAVLPVYGVIGQKMNIMTELCGGCSTESLTQDFRAALADDSITAIVFDIDSPGGTVTGVPELAAEILAARGKKKIIAVSNGMAASAAYWIASAADTLVVIPSGEVGSIGVYCTHQDVSKAMENAGVAISFIQAGKFKTEGNPYEPLSDAARADMQKGVDEFYDMFVQGVADGRGVSVEKVKADFGQGRMLMAKDALAAGMVDSIATLDQIVTGLGAQSTVASEVPLEDPNTSQFESKVALNSNGCNCMCNNCVNGECESCSNEDCDDLNCDCGMDDDDGLDDGNGAEVTPAPVVADNGVEQCECLCPACRGGNCASCTDENCNDSNCDCLDTDYNDDLGMKVDPKPVEAVVVAVEPKKLSPKAQRKANAAAGKKTKRVDGEDLEKSAFAYQGSDELADWKLPIEFSTDAKSKSHTENAIARWSGTDMPNAAEKEEARTRISASAKKYGITLAKGDLAMSAEEAAFADRLQKLRLLALQIS